jgi:signal transduction histidine kinase
LGTEKRRPKGVEKFASRHSPTIATLFLPRISREAEFAGLSQFILWSDVWPTVAESDWGVAMKTISALRANHPVGYRILAAIMFAGLMATSYEDYGTPISLVGRIVGSTVGGALLLTESLLAGAIMCGVVGFYVPAFFEIQLGLALLLFIVAWRTSLPLTLTSAIGVAGLFALYFGKSRHYPAITVSDMVLSPALITALAVGAGAQTRRLRVANERLVELAAVDRRNAVIEERRRIARELHDVAAHHLSAVVVKSKLALRINTVEDLRQASEFAATSAGEALGSMRQLVGVLSDVTDGAPLAPQPRLEELAAITRRMVSAGLNVEMTDLSTIPALSRQIELAVVRIVQEALTNVLRHRGPGDVWVSIVHSARAVDVMVDDDGAPPDSTIDFGQGHGLVSMRERATACGGDLRIECSPKGGWRIGATLPTTP